MPESETKSAIQCEHCKPLNQMVVRNVIVSYPDSLTDLTEAEAAEYVQRGIDKYGHVLSGIELRTVEAEPDMLDVYYDVKPMPFQRLRRITGYLVGDLKRWNNGKRAEEHDRVKHGI